MAAPTFKHEADDVQASIAEMAVARASRPPFQDIIRFAQILEDLILEPERWDVEIVFSDFIILSTAFEPEGLLAEAISQSGRQPNVHHLSWFKRMKITRSGEVHLGVYQNKEGIDTWTSLYGGEE